VLLIASSVIGLVAFAWPLFAPPTETNAAQLAHTGDAPILFAVVLPLLLALLFAELADGSIDAKAVAVLGVLIACGAALRLPTGGITGFSPVFFLLIPAGRVFGAGFGFVLGCLTLFASALVSGGVGPWLPFQMFAAGWLGLFAGMLPPARGKREIVLLAAYGAVAGMIYGLLLNLWFWPYGVPLRSGISFVPGAAVIDNLGRFWAFHLTTSLGFDVPRAVGNVVLVLTVGPATLGALRRTARRAAFGVSSEHLPDPGSPALDM
jgi:energy-coupling factor transport system substrate-specific component